MPRPPRAKYSLALVVVCLGLHSGAGVPIEVVGMVYPVAGSLMLPRGLAGRFRVV